mgnify:CR=1 FL=1
MKVEHSTVRTAMLPTILKLIAKEYGIDEETAFERFYTSKTGECYADDRTGLYSQSALYILSLYKHEVSEKAGDHNGLAFRK